MFIPLGDTPNPQFFRPWVNWSLMGVNILVYLVVALPLSQTGVDPRDPLLVEYLHKLMPDQPISFLSLRELSAYDLFVFAHGYRPAQPEFLDLITCMFLHAGLLHLAGNMLFLWIFGDNIEHRLGRIGYLLAYLGTGMLSTLAFSLFAKNGQIPLVGASGAISGVIGMYFVMFPRNRVKVFVALFPFFFDTVLLPVRWVLGFYIVADNLLPFLIGSDSNVAFGAHLGGFVAGLGLALAGEALGWSWPWQDRGPAKREFAPRAAHPLERLSSAIREQRPADAINTLEEVPPGELGRLSPDECVVLADWLHEAGHPLAAARLLRRCLSAHGDRADLARVFLHLGLLALARGQPTTAYQHLLSVFDYKPDDETAMRAREALARIERRR